MTQEEFDAILKYTFMCNKPVAILTDASFWGGYGEWYDLIFYAI